MYEKNKFFDKFADFVVGKRNWLVPLTFVIAFIVYAGIPNLRLDTDGRVFMGPNNPDKQTLDLFEQEFAKSKGKIGQALLSFSEDSFGTPHHRVSGEGHVDVLDVS